jgi:hypothetical protein
LAAGARARGSAAGGWFREHVTTTPGKLGLAAVVMVIAAICFGVVATAAERSRAHAARAVRLQTEPLLVQAVGLYTALSDANATATTTFLKGGLEPPARRARYLADLQDASAALTTLTRETGDSADAGAAVRTIGEQLPVYSGLVETARANNRQGFPVGAAYLREASAVLTGTLLPASERLYAIEARRLSDNYATGTSTVSLVVLAAVAVLALALLIVALVYLARASRRILNIPATIGAVLLAAVSVWAIVGLMGEHSALAGARRASDSVEVESATRVLLSRAQSDQSLTLVNRGSDEVDPVDFMRVMSALAPPAGLVGEAPGGGAQDASRAHLLALFNAYRSRAARITRLESQGRIPDAIALASSAGTTAIAERLDAALSTQISAAQGRFRTQAADATGSLSGLSLLIPLLAGVVALLALAGVGQRLGEYR